MKEKINDIYQMLGDPVNEKIKKKDSVLYFSVEELYELDLLLDKFSNLTDVSGRYSIILILSYINYDPGKGRER